MMMTQETALLKAQEQFQRLVAYVQQKQAGRLDQVERHLFAETMRLCRSLLEAHVAGQGDGDVGARTEHDGQPCQRIEKRERRYVSIFGELEISRWVYAPRKGQKQYAPLD